MSERYVKHAMPAVKRKEANVRNIIAHPAGQVYRPTQTGYADQRSDYEHDVMLCYVKRTAVVPELRVTLRPSPDDRTPVHHRFQYR